MRRPTLTKENRERPKAHRGKFRNSVEGGMRSGLGGDPGAPAAPDLLFKARGQLTTGKQDSGGH
jgi:hypothetical protein